MKRFCFSYLLILIIVYFNFPSKANTYGDDDSCKEIYHYELTECDSEKGRWRVRVPASSKCNDVTQTVLTRVNNCTISCEVGYYYDLSELQCRACPPGRFSLGGGILIDSWDKLPDGFHSQVESFRSTIKTNSFRFDDDSNCSSYGWQPRGDYLASFGGPCAATLTYTVHLVKPGNLTYTYQYLDKDVFFDFEMQNEQCQSVDDGKEYRWPSGTREGEWKQHKVRLKTGQNLLQWKTFGMDHDQGKPVLIQSIEISGVSLTSDCSPCRAGTYSQEGARECHLCPENHWSKKGASSCNPCDNITEYAPQGSSKCRIRRLCTNSDYFETHTPCDSSNQTQKIYQWIQPKICRGDRPGSSQLPKPSAKQACPPCNPGWAYANGSRCQQCPRGSYSDGYSICKRCPAYTTPNYGYQLTIWNEIPPMMTARCFEPDKSDCEASTGWQVARTHIHSGHRHKDRSYLLLSLYIPGFRSQGGVTGGSHIEVGRISFEFELVCSRKCEFVFMQGSYRKGISFIQNWFGPISRQEYTFIIRSNDSYKFSWGFQQLKLGEDQMSSRLYDDQVRIYSINVTNTIDGGASKCLPCRQESESIEEEFEGGCIPCPAGQYMDSNTSKCTPCPIDHVVSGPLAYGISSCEPCGPGLHSNDGVQCTTPCEFEYEDSTYDFHQLASPFQVKGSHLFTASGAQYYYLFNISLCSQTAVCSNNVSYQQEGQATQIKSFVCRTTIVPSQWLANDLVLSTQSVTLGDELIGVTTDKNYLNIKVIKEFEDLSNPKDLNFFYLAPLATRSCPQGRISVITLHCDKNSPGNGSVLLPSHCPDGTCDGCNFNFFWSSELACPVCKEHDFKVVKGECLKGYQTIHYLPPDGCLKQNSFPTSKIVSCKTYIPLEYQAIIAATVALALLLCSLMLYFWRRTQSLEYKYMKLVQSSGGQDGETEGEVHLPPAESCALDDGEEEEIQFNQPRPAAGLLNRLKAMTAKTESGNPFETIHLNK